MQKYSDENCQHDSYECSRLLLGPTIINFPTLTLLIQGNGWDVKRGKRKKVSEIASG